jgi:hypothetical protein
MVENADVFNDLSNTSLFNQSEFLQKSMNQAIHSFQKLLPTHSQIREDEAPDELPRFGATDENIHDNIAMMDPEPDEIDKSVERIVGTEPLKALKEQQDKQRASDAGDAGADGADDQASLPINDDSFSNL